MWDGDPGTFWEFTEAARLYEQGTAPHKRAQVAPRIAAELTGSAKKHITGQPADWLSFQGGVERLIEKLRQGLGRPKISEVTEHLTKFFKHSRRTPGESVNDYVARRTRETVGRKRGDELFRELEPPELRGFRSRRRWR